MNEDSQKFDSTDDRRIENNIARHQYRKLTDEEKSIMAEIKNKEQDFVDLVASLGQGREYSNAITNMQQASMWAVRGLTA